jgi:hypothetical protein
MHITENVKIPKNEEKRVRIEGKEGPAWRGREAGGEK